MIRFEVAGNPQALKRHRTGKFGNYDPSKQDKESFLILAHMHRPSKPLEVPLNVEMTFYFPRPKSHYGTGKNVNVLKENAPTHHTKKPDAMKLARAVEDALTGIVWKDDSQVWNCMVQKEYTSGQEFVEIRIWGD